MRRVFFILSCLLAGPISIWGNDDLVSDFQMRHQALQIANIPTSERKCTGVPVLVYSCGFKFELEGEVHRKDYSLMAFGSPKTIYLLKNPKTGVLTSSTGQEYFWNRIIFIFLCCLSSFFTAFILMRKLFSKNIEPHSEYVVQPTEYNHPSKPAPTTQGVRRKKSFGQRKAI